MPLPTGATTGSGSGDSNRMSTGVIAGIAVGGVAIVTLAVATLLFILRHRRRRLSPIYVETAEDLSEKTDGLVGSGAGAVAAAPQETTWQPGRPASAPLQARPVESPIPPVAAATELPGEVHPNRGIPPMAASPDPTSNPTSYRGQSPTPAVGDEIAQLMEKKARVDERRKRLLELEQLDSEADAIDQRLVLLRRQGGG
ncbi:hypothetical protein B0T16DRAFT_406562 [Cercophora newfieldiana]|uniref:Uncharacterized protein n=1 Tax=Cercophora newfieldiana TaxID=92897 RepID=A0AA39YJG8_9PEZI|nr:hypothetical protein B0T16DRAFT_406562 [Cercophora newfieldiana]